MDKDEIIKRLKEHLKARENMNGELTIRDKYYCIHYVEDFLEYRRKQAEKFLEENLPMVMSL